MSKTTQVPHVKFSHYHVLPPYMQVPIAKMGITSVISVKFHRSLSLSILAVGRLNEIK